MKESIEHWLLRHDLYLWGENLIPGKALALAKAQGHDVKMRAFVRLARQECHWWRAEPVTRLGRRGCLTAKEWDRLHCWVRNHSAVLTSVGSLKSASRLTRRAGLVGSPEAVELSMKAMGLAMPTFPPVAFKGLIVKGQQVIP